MPYIGSTPAATALTADDIADGAITTVKINDDAVTLAKLASGTDGNIITFDASGNPAAVSTGTSGQLLTSAGAGSPPTFTTVASAGWEFVSYQSISDASSVDFESFESGFDYQIWGYDMIPGTDNKYLYGRFGTGGTPTYQSSAYTHQLLERYGGTSASNDSLNASHIQMTGVYFGNASANEQGSFRVDIFNPMDSGAYTHMHFQGTFVQGTPAAAVIFGGGFREVDESVTAFRMYMSSGNINGRFYLYKRKNTS